ncbi:MAG: lysylphosphatidylglycerol synthase domain-containing protein, partial [Acidobacteriota bacterium]
MTRKTTVALLRWAGTAAAIAYVATLIDPDDVGRAAGRISAGALAGAVALVALNVVAGAARWRALLAAYGAATRPSLARATRLYFISFFYNNYLPGAVAGDVVRGVVARDAFGERGTTASLAVVVVERALGLVGIFVLLAVGLLLAGGALDAANLWLWSAIGLTGSLAIVLALPLARRIAPHLPGGL